MRFSLSGVKYESTLSPKEIDKANKEYRTLHTRIIGTRSTKYDYTYQYLLQKKLGRQRDRTNRQRHSGKNPRFSADFQASLAIKWGYAIM